MKNHFYIFKQWALRLSFLMAVSFLLVPLQAQQDAIAQYFSEWQEEEGFTSIHISARMFRLIAQLDKNDQDSDMAKAINQLGGLRILAADSTVFGKSYYDQAIKTLNLNRYEELMRVKESNKGELVFLIQESDEGKITELLMLSGGLKSFFMLSFIGDNLDLDKISKLGDNVDIEGLDQLGNLKNKRK